MGAKKMTRHFSPIPKPARPKRIPNPLKPSRLVDPAAVEAVQKPWCEIPACGRFTYGADPHHIVTRGSGGPDHRFNLIQLCGFCHYGKLTEGKYSKDYLFGIIAERESVPVEFIKSEIRKMRGRG